MDNLDSKEKFWGGIFGIIAIAAALCEMVINGISLATIVGAVKDVSGTMVVVVVLVAFVKSLPKKPKNMLEKLEYAVEEWGKENVPMIFKIKDFPTEAKMEYKQGFFLLQNPDEYINLAMLNLNEDSPEWDKYARYGKGNNKTGRFIYLPSYENMINEPFTFEIYLEQKHFQNDSVIDENIVKMVDALNKRENKTYSAERVGKSKTIRINYIKAINTEEESEAFVDVLDFVLSMVKVIA